MFTMGDQFKLDPGSGGRKGGALGPTACIADTTERSDLNRRYVDVTAMIRSLQRTEGSSDCFRRGLADCDQQGCAWRQYCLGGMES